MVAYYLFRVTQPTRQCSARAITVTALLTKRRELYRIQKKTPAFQNPACERCVYIELLDKVVQPYMQPRVVGLPLLPGMPPTSVWVMPTSAVCCSPAPRADPAAAGCCCSTSSSSPGLPRAEVLLLTAPPAPPQQPDLPTHMGPGNAASIGGKLAPIKKCFYKCVFG